MFPLGPEAWLAATRCCEGAAEVLSFVANRTREDALTHVILILPHGGCGAKLLAHFPSPVWGHLRGGGGGGPRLAGILNRWHRIFKIPTTVSDEPHATVSVLFKDSLVEQEESSGFSCNCGLYGGRGCRLTL